MNVRTIWLWAFALTFGAAFGSSAGFPARGWFALPQPELALTATVVGALLLSSAVVSTIASSVTAAPLTVRAVAAGVLSLAIYCGIVGLLVFTSAKLEDSASTLRFRGFLQSGIDSGKSERFEEVAQGKNGRFLASLIYRESGLHLRYRNEAGLQVVFEPTPEDERLRDQERIMRSESRALSETSERQVGRLRTGAFVHLAALPTVALIYLLQLRRRSARASAETR